MFNSTFRIYTYHLRLPPLVLSLPTPSLYLCTAILHLPLSIPTLAPATLVHPWQISEGVRGVQPAEGAVVRREQRKHVVDGLNDSLPCCWSNICA